MQRAKVLPMLSLEVKCLGLMTVLDAKKECKKNRTNQVLSPRLVSI